MTPKPQTGIPTLPEDIPPKSDNPSPSKGLKEFLPQTPDELPKQPPKKLNRKKLLKLAESISKDMDRQTADEVLDKFFVLRAATPDDRLEEIKRRNELGTAGTELKTALLAGLLERMPKKQDDSGGWATLPSGQTVQDKDVANWNRGYNQGIADAVEAIKEYFGITGIPIPKEEYVKLAGEVKEIVDKEYLGSDV